MPLTNYQTKILDLFCSLLNSFTTDTTTNDKITFNKNFYDPTKRNDAKYVITFITKFAEAFTIYKENKYHADYLPTQQKILQDMNLMEGDKIKKDAIKFAIVSQHPLFCFTPNIPDSESLSLTIATTTVFAQSLS